MRHFSVLAALALTSAPASAAQFFLSTGVSVLGQGQVSDYTGHKGIVEERFNRTSSLDTCAQQHPTAFVLSNVYHGGDGELVTGAFINHALPPGTTRASLESGIVPADRSCYLAAPSPYNNVSIGTGSPIQIDFAPTSKLPVLYMGFYWGTIDSYNSIQLFSKSVNAMGNNIPIIVSGLSSTDGTITGADILALANKPGAYNSYVGFQFSASENFGYITEASSNTGFETDNYAYSLLDLAVIRPPMSSAPAGSGSSVPRAFTAVSEPTAAFGLMGLGLGAVAFARRARR